MNQEPKMDAIDRLLKCIERGGAQLLTPEEQAQRMAEFHAKAHLPGYARAAKPDRYGVDA